MAPFYRGFNCLKTTEELQRDNLLSINKSQGVSGGHLINLGKIKGYLVHFSLLKSFPELMS